jgi:hypothetical protein
MKSKLVSTLIVISFGLLLSACGKTTSDVSGQIENKTESREEAFSKKSTLKTLLGMGKSLNCTYEFTDSENKLTTKGTTYVSGKNFATDIETTNPADTKKTLKNHMISDGEYLYTWGDDQKGTGMKVKMEASTETDSKTVKTDVAGVQEDMEKEYDMKCSPWGVDQSKFTVPSNIKFTDLSEIMKNIPSMPNIPNLPNISE